MDINFKKLFRTGLQTLGKGFKNALAPKVETTPYTQVRQPISPLLQPKAPLLLPSYQVQDGDTFVSIAEKFNLSETQLQDTNKMLVPPPKGSYITVQGNNPQTVYSPPMPRTTQDLVNQGVPAAVAAQLTGSALPAPYAQPGAARGFSAGTNYAGATPETRGHVSLGEVQAHLESQIAAGKPPVAIPNQLLAAFGETPQSMVANGYTYNTAAQEWTLASAAGNQPPPPQPKVFYSRSRGYVSPEVARLLEKRRARRREINAANRAFKAPGEATNAGGTPVTTLDVRVGSG